MAKAKKEVGLKKGRSNFSLIGTVKITDFTFSIDKESEKTGYIYSRMNLGVDCGNGNVVYSEMMGGYYPNGSTKVYAHGKKQDGKDDYENQLVLDWDERLNPKILTDIGDQCFIRIGIEKDTKGNISTNRFLSAYDAIEYLQANLKDDMVVIVSGSLEHSVYEGETQTKKKVNSVFLSKAKPEEFKAKFTQTYLLRSDFLGKVDADKNSITAYGYVPEYVSKINGDEVKKTLLIPKTFEFDLARHNESVVAQIVQKLTKFKSGYLLEMSVDGEFREGVSTKTTSFEDLKPDIKLLVQMGIITEEEAFTKSAITGNREKRMIFHSPHIINTVSKNEDGSEAVNSTLDINPEKYVEANVEFYSDYSGEEEEEVGADDLSDSDSVATPDDLAFLDLM